MKYVKKPKKPLTTICKICHIEKPRHTKQMCHQCYYTNENLKVKNKKITQKQLEEYKKKEYYNLLCKQEIDRLDENYQKNKREDVK